jgi:NAD(P)-dependent dehydrogenase (short-subunit alcohol dehydrogenase family)
VNENSPRLTGRRILLTGASSGVGLETARLLGAEGARLALLARGREALEQIVAEHGLDAIVLPVDLTDRAATEEAVRLAAEALGGLDVVVSNAAAAVFGHVLEVHPDDFDRTLAVTFGGAVNVIRAALPHLRASRGTVVATGSLMARVPLPTWSSYSAAKHALRGFLNSLAIEEREQRTGVRVAIVHPGPIDTPLFAQASSATGLRPRVAPDAYRSDLVARALVEMVVRPRPEITLGGETRLLELAFSAVRPIAETVLLGVDRWYRNGEDAAPHPGSLYVAPVLPQSSGGIPARDSLLAPLRFGRRLLPSPTTPLRIARHLVTAADRGVRMARELTQPVAERPAPARGLAEHDDGGRPERAGEVTV